ncbi:uncharacterized protein [Mytilus edulis]|uniref:uncharacterized protein n=1 Tax=Mytilus edulis TaxID=6550 RepID=UPI0039EE9966
MASSLSQEEENYVRINLLMAGISARAARALFDREFAPACLDSSLKKEYDKLKDLQRKQVLKQSQWNLLFPRFPDVPDSKTFDVTLIIMLLRNLTDQTPPHSGYDKLPSANETTPTSDLARIKYYRNFLSHLDDGKIDNTTFATAWNTVTDAIGRLGGQQMKQECDDLKVKTLDQNCKDIIHNMKLTNDELIQLKQSMGRLEKSNEDMTVEMNKLKTAQEDTVPWNIRVRINENLVEWKENDRKFIKVRASNQVLKCIKENSCVTVVAGSGVGKTATLRHVTLQMANEGYDLLPVTDPSDIFRFDNPNKKTLFVIDDLCGNYSLSQADLQIWEPVMERMKKILSNKLVKIIAACRLQVFQDDKFESLSVFKSCVCNLLSDNMRLSKVEKESIAGLYLKAKASEIKDFYNLHDCFPLLCNMYYENPSLDIIDFFQNPYTVYEAEIDKLQKMRLYAKYCVLALCVMFNNNLKEEMLTEDVDKETKTIIKNTCEACKLDRGTSRLNLQDELNSFIHTFLKKEQNIYKTIHDKIFDFLVYFFGQKIIICLIKYAHSSLIKERFLLEKQDNMDQFITVVSPEHHKMYIQRMIVDWSKGKVVDVFCNINMDVPRFRKKFLSCLNELDVTYQKQLALTCDVRNKDTPLLQLCFKGDVPMIQWCIKYNVNVNLCRFDETSPLGVAAQKGWTEIVKLLLNKGADFNKSSNDGLSPVMCAVIHKRTEIVRMLLQVGADYDKCTKDGWSPLMCACKDGHKEIVGMLLDIGADYTKCNNDGWSAVTCACSYGHTKIVRMLLDKGADYNKCNNDGWSPVMCACTKGHTEIVKMLLDIGVDYNKCTNYGWSPIISACKNGNIELVRMLLNIGADYNKYDNDGWSPILTASRYGRAEIVRMLLDKGAEYNRCNNSDWSPIMLACIDGHTDIVRMLLDIGADYNTCNNEGISAVIIASNKNYSAIVSAMDEQSRNITGP